jgi:hypothetical protein
MGGGVERGLDWAGLPVIASVARLLCRELTLQGEHDLGLRVPLPLHPNILPK